VITSTDTGSAEPFDDGDGMSFVRLTASRGFPAQAEDGREFVNMTAPSVKPAIPFSVFQSVDIRVGTIELVEEVPKSDKLLRLTVDFGDHKRRILSGMKKERENPQELRGRQALFIVNLEPRKMMGETSEGMLFDLGSADGILPALAVPERPVPNGTRAG
jgi:tRNA-binding protein